MAECPYCKKSLDVSITGERPWWKNPGCLIALVLGLALVVWSQFFDKGERATKQDIAAQAERITTLERKIDELATKLDRLNPARPGK
jgi:hypothetical protein